MLLAQAEAQRQSLAAVAGFDQGFNKKKWRSPFIHRSECKQAKIDNVKQSCLQNLEKSVNTANNTSMFYMNHYKKQHKDYDQWHLSQIYKQHQIQGQILKSSMIQNNFGMTYDHMRAQ